MEVIRTNVVYWSFLMSLGLGSTAYAAKKESHQAGLCERFLSTNAEPLEITQPSDRKFAPFLSMLHRVMPPTPFPWAAQSFNPHGPVDIARFMELVGALRDRDSPLNQELNQYIQMSGGIQNPALWDYYLRSYDKIAAFSTGMLQVASVMDEVMPKFGRIAEFGSGSGNISSLLAIDEPGRQLLTLDFARNSLNVGARKLNFITDFNPRRFQAERFDLKKDKMPPKSLDGAVMNNVLYTLGYFKLKALANIRRAMKDGAPFVISDVISLTPDEFQKFLIETAISGLQNGSPAREIDIVIPAKINLDLLLNSVRPEEDRLLTIEEHRELYEEAGFIVHGIYRSYHNASVLFYLTAGETKEPLLVRDASLLASPSSSAPSSKSGSQ